VCVSHVAAACRTLVLLSTLLHATEYMFLHNLLNVLVQIAHKMGLQKEYV
jgi:hypothetical protein